MRHIKEILKEVRGAEFDTKQLEDNGWYQVDNKGYVWAHTEHTGGDPVSRIDAINALRKNSNWELPELG